MSQHHITCMCRCVAQVTGDRSRWKQDVPAHSLSVILPPLEFKSHPCWHADITLTCWGFSSSVSSLWSLLWIKWFWSFSLKRVSLFDYRGTPLMLSQIWCFQFLSPNTCLWPSCLHVVLWKGHWVNLQRTRASVTASEAFSKPQPQFMLNHILSARNTVKP